MKERRKEEGSVSVSLSVPSSLEEVAGEEGLTVSKWVRQALTLAALTGKGVIFQKIGNEYFPLKIEGVPPYPKEPGEKETKVKVNLLLGVVNFLLTEGKARDSKWFKQALTLRLIARNLELFTPGEGEDFVEISLGDKSPNESPEEGEVSSRFIRFREKLVETYSHGRNPKNAKEHALEYARFQIEQAERLLARYSSRPFPPILEGYKSIVQTWERVIERANSGDWEEIIKKLQGEGDSFISFGEATGDPALKKVGISLLNLVASLRNTKPLLKRIFKGENRNE